MAMISVPSSEPPKRITIPTPAPNTIPPKTVAKRRSSVKTGTLCKREVVIDRTVMPKRVERAKVFPICLYPRKKKGIFKIKINTPNFQPDKMG